MNLSKLILNPRNPGVQRDVSVPYGMHQTLLRGIDHLDKKDRSRLLFRIESERGLAGPSVLVQTNDLQPDWSVLTSNGYLLKAHGPKPFSLALRSGQQLTFRLVANPTKKVDGKRIPLTFSHHDDPAMKTYMKWLDRKADLHGFKVLAVQDAPFRTASNRGDRTAYRKRELPFFGVRFDGFLEVIDPEMLHNAVRQGIGPAKAFGFGLLSLAPAS